MITVRPEVLENFWLYFYTFVLQIAYYMGGDYMYIKAAKDYLYEIKPVLEEAGRTGKDLDVKNFYCKFKASLDSTIKDGVFTMKVDYTGAGVTHFNIADKLRDGSLSDGTIDDIARTIDFRLSCLNKRYNSNHWRRY